MLEDHAGLAHCVSVLVAEPVRREFAQDYAEAC